MTRQLCKRVAILVDHHNVYSLANELKISVFAIYDELLSLGASLGTLIDIVAFVPNYQTYIWEEMNILLINGVSLVPCSVLRTGETFKDTVDLCSLIWITKYSEAADLFLVVTGDGDFHLAINELKKRGKEVQVLTVNFKNTGDALFRVALVKEITVAEKQIAAPMDNPFWLAIAKALEGSSLNTAEKKRLCLLKKAETTLASMITEGMTLPMFRQALAQKLKLEAEVCQAILEVLIALEEVQLSPRLISAVNVQPSSYLQSLVAAL